MFKSKPSGTHPSSSHDIHMAYRKAWSTAFRLGVITPLSDVADEWEAIRTGWMTEVCFGIDNNWSHLTYEEQIRKFADMFDCTVEVKAATRYDGPWVRFYGAKEFMRDLVWNLIQYKKRGELVRSDWF